MLCRTKASFFWFYRPQLKMQRKNIAFLVPMRLTISKVCLIMTVGKIELSAVLKYIYVILLLFIRWKLLFQMGVTKTFVLKNRAIKHCIIFVSLRGAFAEKYCLLCILQSKDERKP